MKKYTLAEKAFISENHPNVIIESYSFDSVYNDIETGEAVYDASAFRDRSLKALSDGTPSEVFCLTIRFRDLNTRHPYHRIWFEKGAQILSEDVNYTFDLCPETVLDEAADADGRFAVTIPFICRDLTMEMTDEPSFCWLSDDPGKHMTFLSIERFHIANQFAEECFQLTGSVAGADGTQDNDNPALIKSPIVYGLTPDWVEEELTDFLDGKDDDENNEENDGEDNDEDDGNDGGDEASGADV